MSTVTCPRPIASLPPLLSETILPHQSSEPAPEPSTTASDLLPMPVEGDLLPFYLDPRGGFINLLEPEPMTEPHPMIEPQPAEKPAYVDPRPFVNCC